jgi:hypothetical protein
LTTASPLPARSPAIAIQEAFDEIVHPQSRVAVMETDPRPPAEG